MKLNQIRTCTTKHTFCIKRLCSAYLWHTQKLIGCFYSPILHCGKNQWLQHKQIWRQASFSNFVITASWCPKFLCQYVPLLYLEKQTLELSGTQQLHSRKVKDRRSKKLISLQRTFKIQLHTVKWLLSLISATLPPPQHPGCQVL